MTSYGCTTARVAGGDLSFQAAPGDILEWRDKGNRRVEIEFETYETAHDFMKWMKDHGVPAAEEKPPYTKVLPTFTFAPADVLAAVKFQNSVYHISFGNGQVADQFERFCVEAGINLDDSRGNVESTVQAVKYELDELKKTHEKLKGLSKTMQQERDREREEKEDLEDRVAVLLNRERALQEALTEAAERELHLKRRLNTQSRG